MRTPPSKEGGQALLAGMFGIARHDKEPAPGVRAQRITCDAHGHRLPTQARKSERRFTLGATAKTV
jgi:hypothetical protein